MAGTQLRSPGYDREEAYFHEKDLALLGRRRAKLDARRSSSASRKLRCPRCGAAMIEVPIQQVKVDRCSGCGGVFLDQGELEILAFAKSGGFFRRFAKRRLSGHPVSKIRGARSKTKKAR